MFCKFVSEFINTLIMFDFKDSELVLNSDGSVYHLKLFPEQIANDIILVGDPGRVATVSSMFDNIEHIVSNREIITHTGIYKGKRMTVMSTGMGTDNIDICINELHVLAQFDLRKKRPFDVPRKLNLIRIGTSGALQADTPVDSIVASKHVIGVDNLLQFYDGDKRKLNQDLANQFTEHTNWPIETGKPYAANCSNKLLNELASEFKHGITLTAPGFYGPQFRNLFIPPIKPELQDKIINFSYNSHNIVNFEMETSALYGLGSLLGHNTLTICLIIANRSIGQFSKNYKTQMQLLIENILQKLSAL